MIEIGGMPILWHIMKTYSHYGFNEFVICAGYKQHVIKEWFADYFLHTSDITFDYTGGKDTFHRLLVFFHGDRFFCLCPGHVPACSMGRRIVPIRIPLACAYKGSIPHVHGDQYHFPFLG